LCAVRAAVLVLALSACHPAHPRRPTTGAIAGLVLDQGSGQPIAMAALALARDGQLTPTLGKSGPGGAYRFPRLAPGRYALTASYAGVLVQTSGIRVHAGHTTEVDARLVLGTPGSIHVDFGDPHEGDVHRFHPPHADPRRGLLEGTVSDVATREAIVGTVVTATSPAVSQAIQVITDDHGRFRFGDLPPGTYAVSAYYTVAGHATIEVKHEVAVHGGEGVSMPLFIETEQ
jgi:Carboxypeptidase regulatory-like domain